MNFVDPEGKLLGAVAVTFGILIPGAITYIIVKCLKDCAEENPCNDPENPNRAGNIDKCLKRCMLFLEFLGWTSPKSLALKGAGAIGGATGGSNSK